MKQISKMMMVLMLLCLGMIGCGRNTGDESAGLVESTKEAFNTEQKTETDDSEIASNIHTFRTQNIVDEMFAWQQVSVISDLAGMTEYRKTVEMVFSRETDFVALRDFRELADSYDAQWFQENTLLAIPLKHSNWDYEHEVQVYGNVGESCLEISISAKRPTTETYVSDACWIMLIEIENAEIKNFSEARVSVEESVDEEKMALSTVIKTTVGVDESLAPVMICNVEELREICKENYKRFQSGDELWMPEEMQGYQKEWFEDNALVLVYVLDSVKGFTYDARAIWSEETQVLELDIFRCIHADGVVFEQVYGQLLVIEIPKVDFDEDVALRKDIIGVTLPEL